MAVPNLRDRLKGGLARRRAIAWLALLGALLASPSLPTGRVADDWVHAIVLTGKGAVIGFPMKSLDLFRFADGDPAHAQVLLDDGEYPWTANPRARLAFFRPLTALTHVADYALWPDSAWKMHAQNLAWLAVAIAWAAVVYRRVLGATWLAGFAALLFAIDDAHGPAVGWIANRNAIVALATSLPVLWLHDRWRKDGWRAGAWLGPVALGIALLAGEASLAIVAYLAAYAWHLDESPVRARVLSLAPYAAVVMAWKVAYGALGYGAAHSGIYIDPGHDPVAFLGVVPKRLPLLLLSQLALPWADFGPLYRIVSPRFELEMAAAATLVVVLLGVMLAPLVRRDPRARFFATGLLLAAVPICSTFTADRLLLFTGIGGMGLVAMFLASAVTRGERALAWVLVVVHVVLAPLFLLARSRSMLTVDGPLQFADSTIPRTQDVATKTVVLVNPPSDVLGTVFLDPRRVALGIPFPARTRILASGPSAVTVTRENERTLRVRPEAGFYSEESEQMLRDPRDRIAAGDVIRLAGLAITITAETADGRPAEALFRFDVPLEDPSLVWLAWTDQGYAPFAPPRAGERAALPAHPFLGAMKAGLDWADKRGML
jgi:hypothetical protein